MRVYDMNKKIMIVEDEKAYHDLYRMTCSPKTDPVVKLV
jgi:hypothetical protein